MAIELDERFTTTPDGPAGDAMTTVPVDWYPPITVVGDRVSPMTAGAVIVTDAVRPYPPIYADIVNEACEATGAVTIENVDTDCPGANVIDEGTVAGEPLAVSDTTTPEGAAGAARPTVQVTVFPPRTLVGLKLSEATVFG